MSRREWVTPRRLTSGEPIRDCLDAVGWGPSGLFGQRRRRQEAEARRMAEMEAMTAPDLTAAEAATVARFDAAPDAEESLRERVALALHVQDVGEGGCDHTCDDDLSYWRDMADAAIRVMRGDDA